MKIRKKTTIPNINKPTPELQAGPRASKDNALNYLSVQTLDPSRLASAFAAADQGDIGEQAKLFELVEEHDAHIFAELGKRRRGVTGLGWALHPPEDATEGELGKIKELTDMLQSIPNFEDTQYHVTDGIGKGFAALEIEWQTGAQWLPKALHWVPQRQFKLERDTGAFLLLKNGTPEPLEPYKWLVHEHKAKSGYIEQSALFRVLAWTYAYKAYNVLDMQRFLEKYGMPIRLGKYPSGLGADQRNELLKALRSIGNDGAGAIPNTMSVDFMQAKNSSTVNDFLSAIEYWERKQSLSILGGTLTSQADGKTSTNALGLIHDKVRREIMLHDVRQIEPTITNQLVAPIVMFNGMFPADRLPKFKYDTTETVDQQRMVDVLQRAANMGMQIDLDWAHQTLQIPRADKKATLLKPASVDGNSSFGRPMVSKTQALSQLAHSQLARSQQNSSNVLESFIAQISSLDAANEQALTQQIAQIVAESGDYDEALRRIEALHASIKTTSSAEQLALALAAANLAGRAEV